MQICQIHPWVRVRQLWYWFVFRVRRSEYARPVRSPRKFEKAELIEKYGFNRHL